MRQFFISFMGALAGFWISILIAMIGGLMIIGAAAASLGAGEESSASIEKSTVLTISLAGQVEERESTTAMFASLMGDDNEVIALNLFKKALKRAADDKSIEGIALECGGIAVGMAQAEEMIEALEDFRSSGKWIYAYGDNYTQGDYLLASVSDSVFINPIGMLDLHGLSSTTIYFKNLLDKIGVEVQVVKVGTYKSAVEPYILSKMSEANREQQQAFLGSIWHSLATSMGKGRDMTFEEINAVADSACYAQTADFYLNNGLVDGCCYKHEFEKKLAARTDKKKARTIALSKYITVRGISEGSSKGKKTIAVLYATGSITEDGDDGIASSRLVPQIFDLAENKEIDGLILRVNSGGGSAFASEQIWEALEQYKKLTGNPFYVSMSDYAASGGYYISCGADKIFADPATLTGSIGIFGLIPNAQKLLNDKLGVNTETVATNPRGAFPNLYSPMTPLQRESMQTYVERGYELFVSRCAAGRDMSVDSIKAIAEGRVWDGATALNIGLVDALGGLEETISDMTRKLDAEECKVLVFPTLEFDFKTELRKSLSIATSAVMKHQMGEFYEFYKASREIETMDPIQCRSEYMILH